MSDEGAQFVRRCDGRVHELSLAHAWAERAEENVGEWGHQHADTLVLALIEEVGEIADALLMAGTVDTDVHGYRHLNEMAQLGRETREYLEGRGPAEPEIVENAAADEALLEEIQDAAPLCWQLYWAADRGGSDE